MSLKAMGNYFAEMFHGDEEVSELFGSSTIRACCATGARWSMARRGVIDRDGSVGKPRLELFDELLALGDLHRV